jgi:hypothetical protein
MLLLLLLLLLRLLLRLQLNYSRRTSRQRRNQRPTSTYSHSSRCGCCMLYAVCCLLCAVCCMLHAVCCILFMFVCALTITHYHSYTHIYIYTHTFLPHSNHISPTPNRVRCGTVSRSSDVSDWERYQTQSCSDRGGWLDRAPHSHETPSHSSKTNSRSSSPVDSSRSISSCSNSSRRVLHSTKTKTFSAGMKPSREGGAGYSRYPIHIYIYLHIHIYIYARIYTHICSHIFTTSPRPPVEHFLCRQSGASCRGGGGHSNGDNRPLRLPPKIRPRTSHERGMYTRMLVHVYAYVLVYTHVYVYVYTTLPLVPPPFLPYH